MKTQILKISVSAVAGLLLLGATSASAITYSLNAPNAAISGYVGPYGFVNVTLVDSTHATITFSGNTVGNYTFYFGGSQMADVNVNATSFDVPTIDAPGTAQFPAGSGNVSEFGKFNVAIDNSNASDITSTVKFEVTNISGTWANDGSVLTDNNKDYLAAAHIIVHDVTGKQIDTGFAANADSSHVVPDGGSTMAMLGTGLLGLSFLRRKFGKKS